MDSDNSFSGSKLLHARELHVLTGSIIVRNREEGIGADEHYRRKIIGDQFIDRKDRALLEVREIVAVTFFHEIGKITDV